MKNTDLSNQLPSASLNIEGVTEQSILRYFETLNSGDFKNTAALFADNGVMYPPFESGIIGSEAILSYLNQEAQEMKLEPERGVTQIIHNQIEVQIAGKVQTPWCGVNVSWLFIVNQQHEIVSATIKLLASPQELLKLKR